MLHIRDDEVHAYVDGELEAGRRRAVEDAISRDPDLGGRVC
jgi:anti-sigma factor RsiW